jgi:hypothetical protein
MVKIEKYSIIFFLLFLCEHCIGQEVPESPNLRAQITQSFCNFEEMGIVQGDLTSDTTSWKGAFRFAPGFSSAQGSFIFKEDSLRFQGWFKYYDDTIKTSLGLVLKENELIGAGAVKSRRINSEFILYSEQDNEGQYDLYIDAKLRKFVLIGSLETLQARKNQDLRNIKRLTSSLGFEGMMLTITGDSCLRFPGLEAEFVASLNFKVMDPGRRWGFAHCNTGTITKYGKKFSIEKASYDFHTGYLEASCLYKTKIYEVTEDSGSVLKEYKVRLLYYGHTPDSVIYRWECEPLLNNEQILSLLIMGDPFTNQITATEAISLEDKIKNASRVYTPQKFYRFTEKRVGRLLAFDRIYIEGEAFEAGGSYGHYSAEKRIAPDFRLSLRGAVGWESDQILAFDYRLKNNIFLISETNQLGRSSIDLRYVIKFK